MRQEQNLERILNVMKEENFVEVKDVYDSFAHWWEELHSAPLGARLESSSRCNSNCIHCLDGESKILMVNFTYKCLKDIKVGDEIIGFKRGETYCNEQTKIVKTKVLATMNRLSERIKLIADKEEIICTPTHSFTDIDHKGRYKQAQIFKIGQKIKFLSIPTDCFEFTDDYIVGYLSGAANGDGCFYREKRKDMIDKNPLRFQLAVKDKEIIDRFSKFLKIKNIECNIGKHVYRCKNKQHKIERIRIIKKGNPEKLYKIVSIKKNTKEYKKGFLAGFLDTDGCLSSRGVQFINTNYKLILKLSKYLETLKFHFIIEKRSAEKMEHYLPGRKTYKACYTLRIKGGMPENIRFLSLTNPELQRKKDILLNKAIRGDNATVIKKEKLKDGKVYNITTESGNYIANGFLSKNCPRESMTRYKGEMSREIFLKCINELAEAPRLVHYVFLHLNGEPLLMDIDELCWRINYAKDKLGEHTMITFFTNAQLLTENISEKLIASKLDKLSFSINGGTKEDYEKIMVGLSYDVMVNNIKTFLKLNNKKIQTQSILLPQKANEHSIDKYFAFWKDSGMDDVGGAGINNIGGTIDAGNMRLPGQFSAGPPHASCWRAFTEINVMADGKVCGCCQDVLGEIVYGDVNKEHILDIWAGESATKLREEFLRGKHAHLSPEFEMCNKCDFMASFESSTACYKWWR